MPGTVDFFDLYELALILKLGKSKKKKTKIKQKEKKSYKLVPQ